MKNIRQNKSILLSNSRWFAYATAGAATALSGATSAEAEIHYSGVINAKFRDFDNTVKSFALGDDAKLVFLLGYDVPYQGGRNYYYGAWFGIREAAVSNQFRGYHGIASTFYVSRLVPGKLVSQGDFVDNLPNYALNFLASSYGADAWGSQTRERRSGFVGFRFDNGAGKQYGWARLRLRDPNLGAACGFILVEYAWGDPGDSITTGQTSSSEDQVGVVPDQGSLGLLALGGTGLVAWRKQRWHAAP